MVVPRGIPGGLNQFEGGDFSMAASGDFLMAADNNTYRAGPSPTTSHPREETSLSRRVFVLSLGPSAKVALTILSATWPGSTPRVGLGLARHTSEPAAATLESAA